MAQDSHGVAQGHRNGERQCARAGDDEHSCEYVHGHSQPRGPPPVTARHQSHQQDHGGEVFGSAVGERAETAFVVFEKGLVIPELREVALRHFFDERKLNRISHLTTTCIKGVALLLANRIGFACDKGIIDVCLGAAQDAVCWDQFLVPHQYAVSRRKACYDATLLALGGDSRGDERKIRGEVPIKRKGVVGFVLKPSSG